jgi:tripartite-type tricarboxylate transporter receptor subunit TctC
VTGDWTQKKTDEETDMAWHVNAAGAVVVLAFCLNSAMAQDYPNRPIRLIVPQSAGGSTDLIARLLAQKMGDTLGQSIVVDNRPGAGSVNGTETVAQAAPDGYTLLAVAASFTITPALQRKLPFDSVRDFAPISQVATLPHILIVHPSAPVKSVKDLIALARAKPGGLNVATSGIATSTHLAAELFMHLTGTKMVTVPYKGGSPSMTAMLAGECQVNFAAMSTAIPHVRSGKVRAIAVSSGKRSITAPEYPTIAEAGVPGYEHSSWVGLLAPAKTPRPIVARLSAEAIKAAEAPDTKPYLLKSGMEPVGGTSAEFAAVIKTEIAKWQKVVKAAGLTTGVTAD